MHTKVTTRRSGTEPVGSRQAGVHDEDPVMLTSFSLGATTALRLSRYAGSRAVLVAGPTVSSYGSLDASTLSIVHRDDDFTKRPWDLDLATPVVSITVPVFTTENGEIVESKNLTTTEIHGAPHDIYTYAASAAQAETSDNRYVAGFMTTARPFFDGAQTMTDYQVKKAT